MKIRAKMARMDRELLTELLAPEHWTVLNSLPPYDKDQALVIGGKLREAGLSADLVSAMLTQSKLRAKAHSKFADFAEGMVFTRDGLEQASRLLVGAYRARRFAAAGITHIADLGCGLGGDALAMSALGLQVSGVEVDEVTATMAAVNLRHFPETKVYHDRVSDIDLQELGVGGVFADPARRGKLGRVYNPQQFSPSLDDIFALSDRYALAVKLGPALADSWIPSQAQPQWISVDGSVVELCLWFGDLRQGTDKRAVLLSAGTQIDVVSDGLDDGESQKDVRELGRYLFEPDGAVIRAGLVTTLARAFEGWLIDESIAYFSSDSLIATQPEYQRAVKAYEIIDTLPFKEKVLKQYLTERNVGVLNIKKRGADVVPEQLRQRLQLRGDQEATVVITRVADQHRALIVTPVGNEG